MHKYTQAAKSFGESSIIETKKLDKTFVISNLDDNDSIKFKVDANAEYGTLKNYFNKKLNFTNFLIKLHVD